MSKTFDIFIVGGGVNGVAIARDAAGRGLSVALAEKGDLGGETSSNSTKLIHGGLRYLEYLDVKLVRHALKEREILLANMPHISWPMRFVLPLHSQMRFENTTPVSKILGIIMPWLKERRPDWIIRFGLWLYDHLGGRKILPPTSKINLTEAPEGKPLHNRFTRAYEYSDLWVQDARLVVLMARDAKEKSAHIMPRNRVENIKRNTDNWTIKTQQGTYHAKKLINAAGPWAEEIISDVIGMKSPANVRLVRGSHIVVPKLYDHPKGYFLQGKDGRIIFVLPLERDFTMIGTTDINHNSADTSPVCSDQEAAYLCDFASEYFSQPVLEKDILWKFAGVRPLFDDGANSSTATTRDYVLDFDMNGPALVSIFGGKITTHRILAQEVLNGLGLAGDWTEKSQLIGGDFPIDKRCTLIQQFTQDFPQLGSHAERIFSCYGLEAWSIFNKDLGEYFGAGLYACEVNHCMENEFAQKPEDILWRRTKLGLLLNQQSKDKLSLYMEKQR